MKGIDYIGGANYKDTIVAHHPPGWAAGFLMCASGWRCGIQAALALAASGRCPVIRIHGTWHDNHSFEDADITKAAIQAKKVGVLAQKYPEISFYFSPWLEPLYCNPGTMRRCRARVMLAMPPNVSFVSGHKGVGDLVEVHGTEGRQPTKYIYSFDGTDMRRVDVRATLRRHQKALICFGWVPQCNGGVGPREKRTDWLTREGIKQVVDMMKGE